MSLRIAATSERSALTSAYPEKGIAEVFQTGISTPVATGTWCNAAYKVHDPGPERFGLFDTLDSNLSYTLLPEYPAVGSLDFEV